MSKNQGFNPIPDYVQKVGANKERAWSLMAVSIELLSVAAAHLEKAELMEIHRRLRITKANLITMSDMIFPKGG